MALCTETCTTDAKNTHAPSGYTGTSLFVPAETLGDIQNANRDQIYILPDNSLWILSYDGSGFVSIASASAATAV